MFRMSTVPELEQAGVLGVDKRPPAEAIRDLLIQRYPEISVPQVKSFKVYYGRFAVANSEGVLSVAYFPSEFDYILDFGFETLVVFKNLYKAIGAGDPTFPHWNEGSFYCAKSEEPMEILFPFLPRDLLVATTGITEVSDLQVRIASTGCKVESKISDDLFKVRAPAYQENTAASKIRLIQGVRYAERNSVVRIIDGSPGWILDRVF